MGTRYLVAVYLDGEYKVAQFGHWDGYPSGAGIQTLEFVKMLSKEKLLEEFKNKIRASEFFSEEAYNSMDEKYLNIGVGVDILRKVLHSEAGFKTVNSLDFAADSLWCEWAWVIDLDKETFEGYRGFNQSYPLSENERFYFLEGSEHTSGYHPVRFVKAWEFKGLPDDNKFIKIMESFDEQEYEEEQKVEVKSVSKYPGILFDSFDNNRYVFLDKNQMYKYCADMTVKMLNNKNLALIPHDYTGIETIIVNKRTHKVYTSKPKPSDNYNQIFGIGIAAAKATGSKIPILIKGTITDVNQIKEGMQLILFYRNIKKPYNQTVNDNNIKEMKALLKDHFDREDIKKIYII